MTPGERELVQVVLGKLDFVDAVCNKSEPSDEDIRLLSIELRFLLVENKIQNAWKLCGYQRQPLIVPPPTASVARLEPRDGLRVAIHDSIQLSGLAIGGIRIYSRALSDDEIRENYERERLLLGQGSVPVPLTKFLRW